MASHHEGVHANPTNYTPRKKRGTVGTGGWIRTAKLALSQPWVSPFRGRVHIPPGGLSRRVEFIETLSKPAAGLPRAAGYSGKERRDDIANRKPLE